MFYESWLSLLHQKEMEKRRFCLIMIHVSFRVCYHKNNHNTAAVYQVTRLGHEHCDITEGELLDITPLVVDGKKLVTLYDKDLTEGINLLIGELIDFLFKNIQTLSLYANTC